MIFLMLVMRRLIEAPFASTLGICRQSRDSEALRGAIEERNWQQRKEGMTKSWLDGTFGSPVEGKERVRYGAYCGA